LTQFLAECSKELHFVVRRLYGLDGQKIRSFEEISDGKCYVATNGEMWKRIAYNQSEVGSGFNAYSKTNLLIPLVNDNPLERRRTNRSVGGLLSEEPVAYGSEQTLFLPTVSNWLIIDKSIPNCSF
jgi:hypothetical protein